MNLIRYPFVNSKVRKFLADNLIKSPPVNVKELLNKNFRVMYTNEVKDGAAIWVPQKRKHLILINPNNVSTRTNWTYAHELGHILLNHLVEHNIDKITKEQHYVLEREANAFAAELLMPYDWIKKYAVPPFSRQKINGLIQIFGVSRIALRNRLINTKIIKLEESKLLFPEVDIELEDNNEEKVTYEEMIDFPKIDRNMRFTKCITCGNEEFSEKAAYCKKCSTYLFNDCLNYDNGGYRDCGQRNVGDALYCEYCGHQTSVGKKIEMDAEYETEYNNAFNNPFEAEKMYGPY